MGNKAHIGFVYTHTKGDGGDHNHPVFTQKTLLVLLPYFVIKACVIG